MVLINVLITNRNFDNETLASRRYSGSMTIENQPLINMDVYFDGFGLINGTINYSNDTLSYEGDYRCIGNDIQFYFMIEELDYLFAFVGDLLTENSIITGDVSFNKTVDENYEGTFYLSLI